MELLKRQKECLEIMQKGTDKVLFNIPRRSGKNRFINFIKERYPKLYIKYTGEFKIQGLEYPKIIIDDVLLKLK